MSPVRRRPAFSRGRASLLLKGILLLPILAVVAGIALLGWKAYHSVYVQPMVYARPPRPTFRAARKVYPFSVIPGGVYDPRELEKSMRGDPTLAAHYNDVQTDRLIAVRTQAPIKAYVSFRREGKICWTSRQVAIPAGELVLTDGHHLIRSRCGNRIEQMKPWSTTQSAKSVVTADADYLALDTPLPSIVPLPPRLQPVMPPGVTVTDALPDHGGDASPTPEPQNLLLFGSGMLLLLAMVNYRA